MTGTTKKTIAVIATILFMAACMLFAQSCTWVKSKPVHTNPVLAHLSAPEYAKLFKFDITYKNDTTTVAYVYAKDVFDAERIVTNKYVVDNDTIANWKQCEINAENQPFILKQDTIRLPQKSE